jgi:hypothetical protein
LETWHYSEYHNACGPETIHNIKCIGIWTK